MERINYLVSQFDLQPHPEGGFYKETYRSDDLIPQEVLREEFSGPRNLCTGIYFLLTHGNFSAFHRIKQDELWHFYEGDTIHIHVIDAHGEYTRFELGTEFESGEQPQALVPKNAWFASEIKKGGRYALAGCTVSPGFNFDDFELADRQKLSAKFPDHKNLIERLTRI